VISAVPRLVRAVVALAMLSLVVGCQARADVRVEVEPDGSGTVRVTGTFDEEAVQQLGGDLGAALRLDDLRDAGWTVDSPQTSGSDTVLVISKPFAAADRLGAVMDELGGSSGLFSGWKVTSSNSFTVSSYEVSGKVRLTGSLDQFSDADVAAALDGLAVGRTPDEIAAALAEDPDALSLSIGVMVPGDIDELRGVSEKDPGAGSPSADFRLGSGTASDVDVVVRSSATDRAPVLWMLIGGALVVAAVLLLVAGARARRRRPPRRPSSSASASA